MVPSFTCLSLLLATILRCSVPEIKVAELPHDSSPPVDCKTGRVLLAKPTVTDDPDRVKAISRVVSCASTQPARRCGAVDAAERELVPFDCCRLHAAKQCRWPARGSSSTLRRAVVMRRRPLRRSSSPRRRRSSGFGQSWTHDAEFDLHWARYSCSLLGLPLVAIVTEFHVPQRHIC